jgi:hypothetical protein
LRGAQPGTITNRADSIRKLIRKLGPAEHLQASYEVGPTGHVLYWQLNGLGVECAVVVPTLVPVKAGVQGLQVMWSRLFGQFFVFLKRKSLFSVWPPVVLVGG